MNKERYVLSQILKSWAQEHDYNFQISSPLHGDDGVNATSSFFSWLIKKTDVSINLPTLLDRLELYVLNVKNKKLPDGCFCQGCQNWYQFAEPNQEDGTLICYSCRENPYI